MTPRRYIARIATVETAGCAREVWIGIETPEPIGAVLVDEFELISAEGMTDDELAIVEHWIDLENNAI